MSVKARVGLAAAVLAATSVVGACAPAPRPPVTSGAFDLYVGPANKCWLRASVSGDTATVTVVRTGAGCWFSMDGVNDFTTGRHVSSRWKTIDAKFEQNGEGQRAWISKYGPGPIISSQSW